MSDFNPNSGPTANFKRSVIIDSGETLDTQDAAGLKSGGVIVCRYKHINTSILAAATFAGSTSYPLWTAPNDGTTYKVIGCSARYTAAAGSAATFQVEVAGAGIAPGSGTAQNSSGVPLNSTANTTVNATITTQTTIAAGSSVNLVVASTATTSLVGCVITVVLQRLS